jgi:hypothetical protein
VTPSDSRRQQSDSVRNSHHFAVARIHLGQRLNDVGKAGRRGIHVHLRGYARRPRRDPFHLANPAVIGPFALPIGMTPLVLLFEHGFEVPGHFFILGAVLAIPSWFVVRGNPPRIPVATAVLFSGAFLVEVSIVAFVGASAYFNVGMAEEPPSGWHLWVRPACKAGGLGLVLFNVGLLLRAAMRSGARSRVL